jgi:hypothetical protein
MDIVMRVVREDRDTGRPVRRSAEVPVRHHGPLNYHCAECGTLLVREASIDLPDVIVICPVCLTLNERADSTIPSRPGYRYGRRSDVAVC